MKPPLFFGLNSSINYADDRLHPHQQTLDPNDYQNREGKQALNQSMLNQSF
jgi:hypothetical protein